MKEYYFKPRQICLFFIAFLPVTKCFLLPSVLASASYHDCWISSLVCSALDLLTLFISLRIYKNSQCDLYTALTNTAGEKTAKVIFFLYALFFVLKGIMPFTEIKGYTEASLYNTAPKIIYFLPFIIVPYYLATKPHRVIGRIADIIWPITLFGCVLLFALSVSNADFGSLLPIGKSGLPNILRGSYNGLNWFCEGTYMLFFIGNYPQTEKDKNFIILSFIFSAILGAVFMCLFYAIFKSLSFRQIYALTEISKYSTVINNVGRFDYIGIFCVLFANIFSISMPVFFASKLLNKVFGVKNQMIFPFILCLLYGVFLFGLYRYTHRLKMFSTLYFGIIGIIFSVIIPLIILAMTKRRKNENA